MAIKITPTPIRESLYLLIPKNVVELIDVTAKTPISLKIRKIGDQQILEYGFKSKK